MSIVTADFCDARRLSELGDFFLRSLGPGGAAKMFAGSTGSLAVTSTSQRIVRLPELSDPCCEAILSSLRAFLETNPCGTDGGLQFGFLVCSLVAALADSDGDAVEHVAQLRELFQSSMKHSAMRLDWSSAKQMLPLVRSVLSSKPWLSKTQCSALSVTLLQAFLKSIPEVSDGGSVGRRSSVSVKVVQGAGPDTQLVAGCLYSCPHEKRLAVRNRRPQRILALNIQLKVDLSEQEETDNVTFDIGSSLDKMRMTQDFIKWLIGVCREQSIDIVANQRVVAEEFVRMFDAAGIACLERLGSKGIRELCLETGAELVSSIDRASILQSLSAFATGTVESCQEIEIGGNTHLNLIGTNSKVSTVLLRHWNEEMCDELQILCDNALAQLSAALGRPFAVPGAGCSEANLILFILFRNHTQSEVLPAICRAFRRLCLAPSGLSPSEAFIDRAKGHLWRKQLSKEDQLRCCCGLVASTSEEIKPIYFSEIDFFAKCPSAHVSKEHLQCVEIRNFEVPKDENVVVDLLPHKEGLWSRALDVAADLASVGIIIQSN